MPGSITPFIRRVLMLGVAITALGAGSASAQAPPGVTEIDVPGGPRIRIVETEKPKSKTVLIDWNKDGKWDVGVVDTDGNGFMDVRWVDANGDGKPQRGELTPIPEPDPDKICGPTPSGHPALAARKQRSARRQCRTERRRRALRLLRPASRERTTAPAPVAGDAHVLAPTRPDAESPLPASTPPGGEHPAPHCAGSHEADIDGDGEAELLGTDANVAANNSFATDLDGDRDKDCVAIGAKDGAQIACVANVDNDPKDQEIVIDDPSLAPNNSYGIDLDGDGDHDIIVVGTKGGGKVQCPANVDNDPNDQEVVVEDPNLAPANSYGFDLDGDGDHDVIVTGTKR